MQVYEEVYRETKLVKQGRKELTPQLKELAEWIHRELGVAVLNIHLDHVRMTPRLCVCLEHFKDEYRFRDLRVGQIGFDRGKQKLVADKFREIFSRGRSRWSLATWVLQGLFVAFFSFEPAAIVNAITGVPEERLTELKAKAGLWQISRLMAPETIFFFHTYEELLAAQANGTRERLVDEYFALVKAHDEFGYVTRETFAVRFDHKGTYDAKGGGRAYYD